MQEWMRACDAMRPQKQFCDLTSRSRAENALKQYSRWTCKNHFLRKIDTTVTSFKNEWKYRK